jgi:hypothetical protein
MPDKDAKGLRSDHESLTDEALIRFNRRGLIPGPEESPEAFCKRATFCVATTPWAKEQTLRLKTLYDSAPDWAEIYYSRAKLKPWEGACTWIEGDRAKVQLHPRLQHEKPLHGLYTLEELLTHELAHVGRMAFNEPVYEEFLACQTALQSQRRFLRTLHLAPYESMLTALLSWAPLFWGTGALWPLALALLATAMKIASRVSAFCRCRRRLETLTERPLAVLYRLTDKEIAKFARMTPEAIAEYAAREKNRSLRWRAIALCYLG